MAGAMLCCSLACNNRRTDQANDSISTDAAGNPDTATMVSGSPVFSKTLTFRQYSFTVNQEGEGSLRRLSITGKDSVNDLDELNEPMEGSIYYAQATDINNDGKPEIFCFAKGADSADYAKVYAYAFEGKKGRQIQLPELSGQQAAGYMGHDSVYLEDKYLVRQFPIYKNDSVPSGSMRTIRYTLRPGTDGYRLEQVQ
jgi:hypothetical protein